MELEAVVQELAPQLLRYALGRTGDPALAEEVAQDALAALVQRWRRNGPPQSAAAFVFAIARRRAFRLTLRRRLMAPLHALLDSPSPSPVGGVLLMRPKHGLVSLVSSYPEPSSPTQTLIVIHGGGQ